MILLIFIIIFAVFVAGILFSPVTIAIDTNRNEYYISLTGYAKISLFIKPDTWKLKLHVLFLSFTFHPFEKKSFEKKSEKATGRKSRILQILHPAKHTKIICKLIKSISIKKLDANIDTNDYPLNALLIPVTQLVRQRNISIHINFENQNAIDFRARTYVYKLVGIVIYIFLTSKN